MRRGLASLLLAPFLFAVASHAAPRDLEKYVEFPGGLNTLLENTIIEGSAPYGGEQPDFLVDWNSPQFDDLRSTARKLRESGKTKPEIVRALRASIKTKVFTNDSRPEAYSANLKKHKVLGTAVPLSSYVDCAHGVCRENAYVLHLAMKEAGIDNRVATFTTTIAATEHQTCVYRDAGRLHIADATLDNLNGPVHRVGQLERRKLFPRMWVPKDELKRFRRPLSESLPYEELEKLLRQKISETPGLEPLWKWASRNGKNASVGGGVVRGLLRWIQDESARGSLERLRGLTPPAVTELPIGGGADLDLYLAKDDIVRLRQDLPEFAHWDISPREAHAESVKAGGTTLDKVLVSPNAIEDPLKGLRAFHAGKLEYRRLPAEKLKETFWFKERGNSETAMALRYLRMAEDLPRLETTSESRAALRAIAREETPHLAETQKKWVDKGLQKLFASSLEDEVKLLRTLDAYALLTPLAQGGYRLERAPSVRVSLEDLKAHGFGEDALDAAKTLLRRDEVTVALAGTLDNCDPACLQRIVQERLSDPNVVNAEDGIAEVLRQRSSWVSRNSGTAALDDALFDLLKKPHAREWTRTRRELVAVADLPLLARFTAEVLSSPDVMDGAELLHATLARRESWVKSGLGTDSLDSALLGLFGRPHARSWTGGMVDFLSSADVPRLERFTLEVLSRPEVENGGSLLQAVLFRREYWFGRGYGTHSLDSALIGLYAKPHARSWTNGMRRFLSSARLPGLAKFTLEVLSHPDVEDGEELLKAVLSHREGWVRTQGPVEVLDSQLIRLLAKPHVRQWTKGMEAFLASADSSRLSQFARNVLSDPEVANGELLAQRLLERRRHLAMGGASVGEVDLALGELLGQAHTQSWGSLRSQLRLRGGSVGAAEVTAALAAIDRKASRSCLLDRLLRFVRR